MPLDLTDFLLTPESAPPIVRSGGRGGAPHEWEKLIGPSIAQLPGQDVLIQVFPKEGLPNDDDEREMAKRQASARAASIANRYWNHVPAEHVETKVRLRPEGNYGVYATHHGPMTAENRERLTKRRAPRGPHSSSAVTEAPVSVPDATPAVSAPQTAAERVKAAAKKG